MTAALNDGGHCTAALGTPRGEALAKQRDRVENLRYIGLLF
jgi:hypothetical protein